ncbi:hypothetical protein SJI00_17965 [Pseudomonas sp. RP23018S]|uniref:hypothetical protein n=1 Tax=Pseudomonas sp. RP23018S TaxID=3096037 RepID=UPI002ACA810D|nr:hypothetical protein [Pseudomonas sp. RP23018S]MDZ5604658.1 hypothetical protein [Pseudomonas sp. RP23018S]
MRWLFLLLVVLNVGYYAWHQHEAPLRVKDVTPLSLYKGGQQEIRLVRESAGGMPSRKRDECLVVGGVTENQMQSLRQRLVSLDIATERTRSAPPGEQGFWLVVTAQSERLLDQPVLLSLSKDFKDLKHKIILCEGVATAD